MDDCKGYKPYVAEQDLLLPPSLRDWLPESHLAYFVSDVVDQLDLSEIHGYYSKECVRVVKRDGTYWVGWAIIEVRRAEAPVGTKVIRKPRQVGFSPGIKLLLIAAPVLASYSPTAPKPPKVPGPGWLADIDRSREPRNHGSKSRKRNCNNCVMLRI